MDEHRPNAVNDAALDRELRSALAVAPPAEFAARVRARVAREVPDAAWWLRWPLLTAGAASAAAALVVLAVFTTPEQDMTAPGHPAAVARATGLRSTARSQATNDVPARIVDGARGRQQPVARRTAPSPVRASAVRRRPDVIVSADEQAAVLMLLRMAQNSSEAERLRDQAAAGPDDELTVLDMRAIEIEPLPQIARLK